MIPLFSPFIPKEAGDIVKQVIDSGFINRGKYADEFEKLMREKYSILFVHLVNSCTSALKLSLAVAGIKEGDEVISTPWSMIATNTAILELGGKPVFVDIDYDTLNIDASKIEAKITPKTKAIMVVHYAGYPVELKDVYRIAHEKGLEVIQDCAHALGTMYRGRYIGSFGRFCCYSFQAIKTITGGDMGAVSTTDQIIYDDIVRRSWFGIDKKTRIKTPVGVFPSDIDVLGYKMNTNDIAASLGVVGLKHVEEAINRRRHIARRYNEEFGNLKNITLLKYAENNESSYWLYPMHVAKNRHLFALTMTDAGIEVGKHNERNDKYKIFGGINQELVNTAKVDEDIVHIPLHASLTDEQVELIIKTIKKWDKEA